MSHTLADLAAEQGGMSTRLARRMRRLPDLLMIASIVTLVVLVSLPRLRAFVLRSNEADAREIALRLAASDLEGDDVGRWMQASSELSRRLQDATLHEGGRLFCFHGFCFSIERSESGMRTVVAWPEVAGESGIGAYVASADGELWVHPNPGGAWSGLEQPPQGARPPAEQGLVAQGWRPADSGPSGPSGSVRAATQ